MSQPVLPKRWRIATLGALVLETRINLCVSPSPHRALRPPLSLGGELRGEEELPLLLHVHPLALLPHHLHLRLRHHAHHFK